MKWIDFFKSCFDFPNFISDKTYKQGITNFSIYSSTSYASVVLSDSKVALLGEDEDAAFCLFLHCVLFIHSIA